MERGKNMVKDTEENIMNERMNKEEQEQMKFNWLDDNNSFDMGFGCEQVPYDVLLRMPSMLDKVKQYPTKEDEEEDFLRMEPEDEIEADYNDFSP